MDPSSHPQVTIWGPGIWIARPRELGDGPFLPPSGNDLEDSHLDCPAWARGDELPAMTDKHVSSFQARMDAAKVDAIVHWTSGGTKKFQIKSEPEINAESNVISTSVSVIIRIKKEKVADACLEALGILHMKHWVCHICSTG